MSPARRPRVGFVSLHTSPLARPGTPDAGGMNVVELALAQALARRGYAVDLITRRASPDEADVLPVVPGVRLVQLTAGPVAPLRKGEHEGVIEEFTAALAGLPAYDLLHSHHWFSGVAALPVAAAWGIPLVASFHSVAALPDRPLAEGEPPESPGRVAGEARVARGADRIVAVSAAEARTVIERCGADPGRVAVVRPGVDPVLFRPARAAEPPPEALAGTLAATWPAGYLLFAGRLEPLKGPDVAISAVAALPRETRPCLVIAGEASRDFAWYERQLREQAAELGVADEIVWVGPQQREELAGLLRGARLLLMPSHSETFGLIALEAQASGVPPLASRSGGLPEAIRDGQTGMLLDDRDPRTWASAVADLLEDPQRRALMATAAREFALSRSWDDAAADLQRVYEGLAVARPGDLS